MTCINAKRMLRAHSGALCIVRDFGIAYGGDEDILYERSGSCASRSTGVVKVMLVGPYLNIMQSAM